MADAPLISFICSAYNRPHMLPVALHCLRANPDFPDWEVIVTDNATDRETIRLHKMAVNDMRTRWGDTRYHYLKTGGDITGNDCYSSAEYAIARCRGRYIHLLCDDGYLVPYFAAKMVGAGITHGWDVVIAGGWVYGPDTHGSVQYTDGRFVEGGHSFVGKMAFIMRREKFTGFDLPPNGAPILADRTLTASFFQRRDIRWGVVHETLLTHN